MAFSYRLGSEEKSTLRVDGTVGLHLGRGLESDGGVSSWTWLR